MPFRMSRGGRPTEQAAPVTRTIHFRLTEAEHARLTILADRLSVPPSRLLRRAVREMVNGGPDLFDDGLQALSETARQLAVLGRNLDRLTNRQPTGACTADQDPSLAELREAVEDVRDRIAGLVRASRERWVVAKAAMGPPARH